MTQKLKTLCRVGIAIIAAPIWMQKIARRVWRKLEIGAWLHMSAERQNARDTERGWINPAVNDF